MGINVIGELKGTITAPAQLRGTIEQLNILTGIINVSSNEVYSGKLNAVITDTVSLVGKITDTAVLFDNNVDRTSELIRVETTDKGGATVVTYTYELSSINTDHTITAGCSTSNTAKIYIKENGAWNQYSKIFVKIDGVWVEQNSMIWSALFDSSESYRKME